MKTLIMLVMLAGTLLPQNTGNKVVFINFENHQPDKPPVGWTNAITGEGKPCQWKIINDDGNKVLAQVSKHTEEYHFNLIVNDSITCKDFELSVKFKGVKGHVDQGGGLVWRYIDKNNYYVARANPLEDNFRLYKVVNGNRIQLKSASFNIETGKWYNMKVVMHGNSIKCYFNSNLKLQTTESTFKNSGKVGLWTKSDAVTWFDNFNLLCNS